MAAQLFCSPAGFSRNATAGDSAGESKKLTCAGPSSLSESLLALSRIGFGCYWLLFIAFICIYVHLSFAFIVCINVCMHHTIMLLSSVQVVPLFWGGCSEWAKTQARVYT